jgi:hypothetical protein
VFTGGVRPSPPAFVLGDPERRDVPPSARWGGGQELRADLRVAARLTAVLAACGLPVGLLWWALAPRADVRVTSEGLEPVGEPPTELAVADDSVLVLLLVGLGLLAGALAWRLRRRRGVAVVVALAVGATLAALVAWQLGELLGPGPTEAELARVAAVVTTPLRLSALPALAAAPFSALLAYLVGVLGTRADDLGRPAGTAAGQEEAGPGGDDGVPAGEQSVDAGTRG